MRTPRTSWTLTVAVMATLLVHHPEVAGQAVPVPLTTDPVRLPLVKPAGSIDCVPYSQLPTGIRSPNGIVSVFYDDGRLGSAGDDCGVYENLVVAH